MGSALKRTIHLERLYQVALRFAPLTDNAEIARLPRLLLRWVVRHLAQPAIFVEIAPAGVHKIDGQQIGEGVVESPLGPAQQRLGRLSGKRALEIVNGSLGLAIREQQFPMLDELGRIVRIRS